jgi:hypothetical protein
MALTATAGPNPYGGTFVELFAAGGTGPYSWRAYPTGGDDYAVPATVNDPTGRVTVDGFAPLGRDILYRVTDSTGAAAEASATLTDPGVAVLSDATDPTRHVLVTVADQLPNEWEARSVWFDILDRRDPFVAVAPLRFRNGELVLLLSGTDARADLLALLAPGTPLVIRSACVSNVDDLVILPTRVREELVNETDKGGARLWTITYQAVTRDLGPYLPDPEWTWELVGMDSRLPSWTAFSATFATWSDAVANIRKP